MARGKLSNKSQPFWKSILVKPKIKFICSSKNFCKVQPPYPRQYTATKHKIGQLSVQYFEKTGLRERVNASGDSRVPATNCKGRLTTFLVKNLTLLQNKIQLCGLNL